MKKTLYIATSLLFLLGSCKKKELETITTSPSNSVAQIKLAGTIDGTPVAFEGSKALYNYTSFSHLANDSIMKFTSTLGSQTNPTSNPSVSIEIKNYTHTNSLNEFYSIDSTFKPGIYPWADVLFPDDHIKRVEIIFFDGTNTYSSRLVSQTGSTNTFEVLSVEDFVRNENGYPTKKLQIEITCLISDLNTLKSVSLLGTIAFSY